jgi:hypothetical protein
VYTIYLKYINRSIINVFSKTYNKRVLISYITLPFRYHNHSHSNNYEVTSAAKIFDELGYVVDVFNYDGKLPDLEKYDVIYGFGDVFQKYFESGLNRKKTIHYGAGMHVFYQNTNTLKRIKDVYRKKGVWLTKSSRFVPKTWTHQTSLVDGIIAVGNELCADTYRSHYEGKVYSLPAPFFKTVDEPDDIFLNRSIEANKSYLWFGNNGLVHKGLDLCLEYFSTRQDLSLHICGSIKAEKHFEQTYSKMLYELPNIHVYGFINIDSIQFKQILKKCSFVIFPSCSEGGGVSVLTAIGNGALIPLITKETSVSTGYEIVIEDFSIEYIKKAVEFSQKLQYSEILKLQKSNLSYVLKEHNQNIYYVRLKFAIQQILNS